MDPDVERGRTYTDPRGVPSWTCIRCAAWASDYDDQAAAEAAAVAHQCPPRGTT